MMGMTRSDGAVFEPTTKGRELFAGSFYTTAPAVHKQQHSQGTCESNVPVELVGGAGDHVLLSDSLQTGFKKKDQLEMGSSSEMW